MTEFQPSTPRVGSLVRLFAAFAGLLALWVGCDLTNAPVPAGGPMNPSFDVPVLGIPLTVLGIIGVAFAPRRGWGLVWPVAALVALVTAGANFWHGIPIEDGAFQSLRTGVPDPDTWPAAPFLHALALAPVGVALAALLPGPGHVAPLLLASAAAVVGSGLGLETFTASLLRDGTGAWLVTGAVPASALFALSAARGGHLVQRAIAGQAAVLTALCLILWLEWSRVT